MSRSAADATRFTATGPYASSKHPGGSVTSYQLPEFLKKTSPSPQQTPAGRQETPKEKVERLRAQARAARIAQSTSRVDRMIEAGRRFANTAHKGMVYTLIAASGVCGVLTVYSVISLTLYNRRQKALWLDRELEKLQNARTAYANGTATAEQLEILKNEQIGEIVKSKREQEMANRPWNKAKQWLFSGLKTNEPPSPIVSEPFSRNGTGSASTTTSAALNQSPIAEAADAKRVAEDARLRDPVAAAPAPQALRPGPLDVLAENAETAARQTTRSWKSWLTGR